MEGIRSSGLTSVGGSGDGRDTDHMEVGHRLLSSARNAIATLQQVSPPPAKRARTSRKKAATAASQAGNGEIKM